MSDEMPEVPLLSSEAIEGIAGLLPGMPGIELIMGAIMMALMPMLTGGTDCECDMCQTLSGVFAGIIQP